jgi:hypothetical protein
MSTTRRPTVLGVFATRQAAQAAVAELRRAGFREDQIGVIGPGGTAGGPDQEREHYVGEGAAVGAVAGAGAGALWAIGIAAGMLPAIGPVIAGGLLASVLASTAGAAVAGGLTGALVGLGLSEEEARTYEADLAAGRTIVTVRTDDRQTEAAEILARHGAAERGRPPGVPAART